MYTPKHFTNPPTLSPSGPSVASLKSECGTKSGSAHKKGWVKWSACYLVLKQGGDTLYEYKTELDSTPNKVFPLKDSSIKIDKTTKNTFTISFPDIQISVLRLSFINDDEMLSWIKALASSGVDTGQMEEFLCNREGKPVKRYSPPVAPLDIASDIEKLL
ncbi:hypothetical protein AC249_AIPGENE26778 [Exaiptasia diaphana]|nr:hypothetical protein AC249_AIPGENE26778 [Exaiptasia diaphana]